MRYTVPLTFQHYCSLQSTTEIFQQQEMFVKHVYQSSGSLSDILDCYVGYVYLLTCNKSLCQVNMLTSKPIKLVMFNLQIKTEEARARHSLDKLFTMKSL